MRVDVRKLAAAPVPASSAAGAPRFDPMTGQPVAAPAPEAAAPAFDVRGIVDGIRQAREGLGTSRELIREVRGLKEDLEALGIIKPAPLPPAPAREEEASGDEGEEAPRPPARRGGPIPPDGRAAAATPGPAPPPTEAEKALREEIRAICARLPKSLIKETAIVKGTMLLEGKKFEKCADLIVDNQAAVVAFLDALPEKGLQDAVAEVCLARPAGDLPMVKKILLRLLDPNASASSATADGSAGPANQSAGSAPAPDVDASAGPANPSTGPADVDASAELKPAKKRKGGKAGGRK